MKVGIVVGGMVKWLMWKIVMCELLEVCVDVMLNFVIRCG